MHEYIDSHELNEQLLALLNREELNFAQQLGIYGWVPTQMLDAGASHRDQWTIPVLLWDLQVFSLALSLSSLPLFSRALSLSLSLSRDQWTIPVLLWDLQVLCSNL